MFQSTLSLKRTTAYQVKDREVNQARSSELSAHKRVVNSKIQACEEYLELCSRVRSMRCRDHQSSINTKHTRAALCKSLGYDYFECKSRRELLQILAPLIDKARDSHLYMANDHVVRNYALEQWVESRQWPLTSLSASHLLYQLTQKDISLLREDDLELLLQSYPSMFATLADVTVDSVLLHIQQLITAKAANSQILLYGADWMELSSGSIYCQNSDSNAVIASSSSQLEIVIVPTHNLVASPEDISTISSLTQLLTTEAQDRSLFKVETTPLRRVVIFLHELTHLEPQDTPYHLESCIHCGRCQQACSTFSLLSAYATDYSPYHAALWPKSKGFSSYHHLSFVCTDCGACDRICPMDISLSEIIRNNRFRAVAESHRSYKEGLIISGWRHFNRRQGIYSLHGVIKRIIMLPIRGIFGIKRGYFRKLASKPFGVWK